MEQATITLENTPANQQISRTIRDFHKKKGHPLTIRFSEEMTHIILEAPCIYLPGPHPPDETAVIDGQLRKCAGHFEVHPKNKGKTINLHLDSELAAELEQIRSRVSSKTQSEVIRELFIRGMRSYLAEEEEALASDPNAQPEK
ncbi:hypothetical protein ACFSO0_16195 [Brevibacillus sp. GCM10020057]|uniref:hypothetical protein n=1 Tax=Brevibacillus sp. GCM10020057 TaxID=3317327 RepID=UPI003633C487